MYTMGFQIAYAKKTSFGESFCYTTNMLVKLAYIAIFLIPVVFVAMVVFLIKHKNEIGFNSNNKQLDAKNKGIFVIVMTVLLVALFFYMLSTIKIGA